MGRMLANNFDTELTDEDLNFYASDEDDEDPTGSNGFSSYSNYSSSKKGTIELGSMGANEDGLTLEEMNG